MDGGSSSFLFSFFVVVAVSFCPSTLHPLFHHLAFSAFCLSPSFCLFLLLLFIHPPLHLPLHSRSHFISLLRSLCLLKVSNKQTSSGWLESPIYNSSQSNYSKHVCQTHEEHLSVLQREREREKKYVLPSWLGHVTQRLSQHSTERLKCCLWHFCFVLIENTQGKGRDDGIGRTL